MKYSYKWLKELSGTDKSPEELSAMITAHAFEVEELEHVGFANPLVVIGRVAGLEKHPGADRLRVAKVDTGSDEVLTIVCGAPNIAPGQKVAVALEGATLPDNFQIARRAVRGVDSQGMICSRKELGLGNDHEGIWVLADTAKIGALLEDFLGSGDTLLNIKVLPDRAHDCLSHVGMAREIAALEGRELDFDFDGLSLDFETLPKGFSIAMENGEGSRRYIGAHMKGVAVGPSPLWLETRLRNLGVRPINNVVDVTNYVMLEIGQPLHAFDWKKMAGRNEKTITIRRAENNEKITLLDGKEYVLMSEDIIIADTEKPLALAGIMGGIDSSVTEETTEVFFEAAHFDPVAIRRTRQRLGLRTDASDRFEKGLSPILPEKALAHAVEILEHITGATALASQVYADPHQVADIACSLTEIESLLGVTLDREQAMESLRLLGFNIYPQDGSWTVQVPSWRLDVNDAADLAEEIGRMIGYDVIGPVMPLVGLATPPIVTNRGLQRTLTDAFVAQGFIETYNYSFYSNQTMIDARLDRGEHLELANPMNPDQAFLRTSLIPNLLGNARKNLKHFDDCALVEFGKAYIRMSESVTGEFKKMAGIMTSEDAEEVFFRLKGSLSVALETIGIPTEWRVPEDGPVSFWHPTRVAELWANNGAERFSLGMAGNIHPLVLRAFDVKRPVACFELSFERTTNAVPEEKTYSAIRKFPSVFRDVALYVPEGVSAHDLEEAMRRIGGDLLIGVRLFDRYRDASTRKTSLAFHLEFAHPERTLESTEIESLLGTILTGLTSDLGVEIKA